mmetsp:Transcript_13943/g.23814  ORF Transcript_13943/g.23814 Transcript_13943/m.23814 type:complete len:309 (+) Transcript_13943:65-991(+)
MAEHTCTTARPSQECPMPAIAEEHDEGGPGGAASSSSGQGHMMKAALKLPSLTSKQLAQKLYADFKGRTEPWTQSDVRARLKSIDPGASEAVAGHVLKRLKDSEKIAPGLATKMLQGLAAVMTQQGWGVVLHLADASSVREQVLELARKKYYGEAKKSGQDKTTRFKAAAVADTLDAIADTVQTDEGPRSVKYVVGWTAVPPSQMNGGHLNFVPMDAIDCAHMTGAASGVMFVRGKKDANRNLRLASVGVLLAAEGDVSVGAHMAAENLLLGKEAFNSPHYLTISDSGACQPDWRVASEAQGDGPAAA